MSLQGAIHRVAEASTREEAIHRAYDVLTARYRGGRLETYTLFWRLFENDIEKMWARTGFLHCTKLNRLLRYLLTESGWVKAEEIQFCWTLVWLVSPHQYVRVRQSNGVILPVDVWAAQYGTPYGDYAHGFH
jgi:hypothetical protein